MIAVTFKFLLGASTVLLDWRINDNELVVLYKLVPTRSNISGDFMKIAK